MRIPSSHHISFYNGAQSASKALAIYDTMQYTTVAVYHEDPMTGTSRFDNGTENFRPEGGSDLWLNCLF